MFHNLQNFDSNLIFQKLWKYNFKTSVIPKKFEKYMVFTIQKSKKNTINPGLPLLFIYRMYFLYNSSHNLFKNLWENDYHLLSKEFAVRYYLLSNVLHVVKKKGYFPYDYWDSFIKFKEGLPSKDNF